MPEKKPSSCLKITHILPDLRTGGAQRLVADLMTQWSASAPIDLTVAVYNTVGKTLGEAPLERQIMELPGVTLTSLDVKRTTDLSASMRMMSLVRESDITHVHLFPALYHAAVANWLGGGTLIFTEHSTSNRRRDKRWLRTAERIIYNTYGRICAISPEVRDSLAEWLGPGTDAAKKITVIDNGVDLSRFDLDRPHPSQLPSIFGRSGLPVVMTSRFARSKDQKTLIRAAAMLDNPDAFIAFAGTGETYDDCRRLAREIGVEDRIEFLGDRDDIPRILSAAAAGVQASHYEGFGLAAVEMLAAGLPLAVTDTPGLAGATGGAATVVPPENPEAMAAAINRLLRLTPGEREAAAQRARRAAAQHTIAATAEKYLSLYRSIVLP